MKVITGIFSIPTSTYAFSAVNLGALPVAVLIMPIYEIRYSSSSTIYPRRALLTRNTVTRTAMTTTTGSLTTAGIIGMLTANGFKMLYEGYFSETSGISTSYQYIAFMEDDE